jgi:Tol biopolymer transport system component
MSEIDRIESWKQIAAYLSKSERTVRRWHDLEGLPVHKHLHQERGTVWASKSEINCWLDSRKQVPASPQSRHSFSPVLAIVTLSVCILAAGFWISQPVSTPSAAQPELFTALPGKVNGPSISPDGRRVAFFWSGLADSEAGIYIKDVGGESVRRLVAANLTANSSFNYNPVWSPDESTIAFLNREVLPSQAGVVPETWLCLVDSKGGNVRRLARLAVSQNFFANNSHLSWSRDGKRILAPMYDAARRGIYWVPVAGGDLIRVAEPVPGWQAAPALSPDESSFLYLQKMLPPQPVGEQLLLQELTPTGARKGEPRIIHSGNTMTSGFAWLPSGTGFLHCFEDRSISASKPSQLYRWSLSSPEAPVSLGMENCSSIGVGQSSKDSSSMLVYARDGSRRSGIWSGAPHKLRELNSIAPSSRWDGNVAFSPDRSKLAFVSTRSGRGELWIASLDGAAPQKLTEGSYISSTPSWSPDGARILFGATLPLNHPDASPTPYRIHSLDVASGVSTRIPLDALPACDPNWISNEEIYFWTTDQLWSSKLDGSLLKKVGSYPGRIGFNRIVDGFLYLTRRSNPISLHRINLATGREALVASQLGSQQFAMSAKHLYFTGVDLSLFAVPIMGGQPHNLGSFRISGRNQEQVGLAVAADDSALAVSLADPAQLDLMLVRGLR